MTTTDTFTPDEREAIRLADGKTLPTVTTAGGLLHGVSIGAADIQNEYGIPPAEETTVEERKERVRCVFFQIAVYGIGKDQSVEVALAKRREKIPEEIRPTLEECNHLIRLAKVFHNRAREDLKKDRLVELSGEGEAHLTDAGNSERLVRLHGTDIRYCATLKQWFVWDGRRWEPDDMHRMLDLATQTAKSIFVEAATGPDSRAYAEWALKSESLQLRRAMIDGAVFMVPVRPDELDAQPALFNCENGTLNLDTGEFREHRREDLCTKLAGVRYDPGAKCPQWHDHLKMIFCGDTEMIDGFQALIGYSLLQFNPEQIMSILYGTGKNAKSETLRAIALIFGDYAVNIEAGTLMQSRYTDGGRARPDVLRLKGARFVTCTEPEQNALLSESMVKSVTGDHTVTARALYAKEVEFEPGGKIFLATNHLPKIKGTDNGIWRRIWPFPFLAVVPADKRRPEYGKFLFEQEGPGIFNWMIEGLKSYQKHGGLVQPKAVQKAVQEYRMSSNQIGRYLDEWCVLDPRVRVGKTDLHEGYREWCESTGWKTLSRTAFGKIVKTLFTEERDENNRYWLGIRRKTKAEIDNDDQPVERQAGLDEPVTLAHVRNDTFSQTFSTTPAREKFGKTCHTCHAPQHPPPTVADQTDQAAPENQPVDKSKVNFSPDPADYTHLKHRFAGQKCSACGTPGVSYRERPVDFNKRRGTAGLCEGCFTALAPKEIAP